MGQGLEQTRLKLRALHAKKKTGKNRGRIQKALQLRINSVTVVMGCMYNLN